MDDKRYDMQVHSFFSDGEDSPDLILEKSKSIGLAGLSITDHDTIDAYTPDFFQKAEKMGLEILIGAELSGTYEKSQIDILAFGMEGRNASFKILLKEHQQSRHFKNQKILQKLSERNMPIDKEDLYALGKGTLGRPHIAALMVKHGYVKSIDEAFTRWIGDGKPCYEEGFSFTLDHIIDVIHSASGIAILAHPHILDDIPLVERLCDQYQFDGVEVFYGRKPPSLCHFFSEFADKRRLLKTGGSDYHGSRRSGISLGCSWASLEMWLAVKERLSSIRRH